MQGRPLLQPQHASVVCGRKEPEEWQRTTADFHGFNQLSRTMRHEDGKEHRIWVLLHHLYSAVAMFELATKDEKDIIAKTQKKLRYFF